MPDVTELLNAWSAGDVAAREALIPLVYADIKAIAHNLLKNEGSVTLSSTALAHEAYLRLVNHKAANFNARSHFFGAVANIMRRVLVDEARKRLASKRGSGAGAESLDLVLRVASEPDRNVVELNEALSELEAEHPEAARVVELRYFGGLTLEDVAEVQGVTVHSIRRDFTFAKAWLARRLNQRL